MAMTALPPAPQRTDDPAVFVPKADALVAALPGFVTEANALQVDVSAKQVTASAAAVTASAAASTALSTANATTWNAATNYAVDSAAISPITHYTYRRVIAGVTATDPSVDTTNWIPLTPISGNQTFTTNGTFTPVPRASYYMIDAVGGGSSGSSNSATNGSGGGGGGERVVTIIPASLVTAPVTVLVGAGGASKTNGNGNIGGNSVFGSLVIAHGGAVPTGVAGGAGGGIANLSTLIAGAIGQYGGTPSGTASAPVRNAEWGGGAGAGSNVAGLDGGSSLHGGGGGGGCGTGLATNGGASGTYTNGGGGAAGTAGSPNGAAGADAASLMTSGAGGGGGYNTNGNGGNGGFPGGGGGGCDNSKASGAGGNGVVRVYWW